MVFVSVQLYSVVLQWFSMVAISLKGNIKKIWEKAVRPTAIVAKKWDPGILDPVPFSAKLGKLRQD